MLNLRRRLSGWVLPAIAIMLCGYLLFNVAQCKVTIGNKRQELTAVQQQLDAQIAANEELSRALDSGEDAIIERIAREQGYAKPNERVFVDISGK